MFSIADIWNEAKSKHAKYVEEQIDRHLAFPAGDSRHIRCDDLRQFAQKNKAKIACGSVQELRVLIGEFETMRLSAGSGPYMDLFNKEAKQMFDYAYFSGKKSTIWCAYELCKTSQYRICPYCNQNFAFTLVCLEGEFRPTLDHFFPKAQYPFLAISLYNLVPSCYTCNSNLKGAVDFHVKPHLHPFDMHSGPTFEVRSTGSVKIEKLVSNRHLMQKYGVVRVRPSTNPLVTNSVKTFLLGERFGMHQSEFLRFAYLRKQLTKRRVYEVQKVLGYGVDASLLLGFDPGNFKNTIHGKIFFDLYRQFRPNN